MEHKHTNNCRIDLTCRLPGELPKARMNDKIYYVDARLRQLRNVINPHDYIDYGDDLASALRGENSTT